MVRVFIRLKVKLSLNRVRKEGLGGWVVIVLVSATILGLGILAGGALLAERWSSGPGTSRLFLVFTLTFLVWFVPAIAVPTSGGDLALGRFAPFPLTVHQKAKGLLAAKLFGFPAVATLIVAVGAVAGYAPAGPGAILVTLCVSAEVALAVVASRALGGVFEVLAQTRRARDVMVVVMGLIMIGTYVSISRLLRSPVSSSASFVPDLGGWGFVFPPYGLARGVLQAREGELVVPLLSVAYAMALVVGSWRIWLWALGSEGSMKEPHSRVRRTSGDLALYAPAWRLLPRNRLGAVAARELRYFFFRKPDQLMSIAWLMLYPFFLGGGQAFSSPSPVAATFSGLWMAFLLGFITTSMYQLDGQALWMQAVAAGPARHDVYAKVMVRSFLLAVPLVLLAVMSAVRTHDPLPIIAGIPLAFGMYSLLAGVGSMLAVRAPSRRSADGRAKGCSITPITVVLVLAEFVLLVPGAAMVFASSRFIGTIIPGSMAAGVYGAVVGWYFLRSAGHHYESHLPEFLERLRVDA